jgi:ferredoxin-NADP reductase
MELLEDVGWPQADRPHGYICGPTPFVEAVSASLVDFGHEAARIKTERFGPTGG